jgi:uncharacterized protein (DUF924 family)
MNRIEDVLAYWYDGWEDRTAGPGSPAMARWFGKAEATDREIRERFEEDHLRAARGELSAWEASARGRLALVILLDQFPRNIYRGTPHAFATDGLAYALAVRSIEEGIDLAPRPVERIFLYLPLMHSETALGHALARRKYAELEAHVRKIDPERGDFYHGSVVFEEKHAVIIERFGRYPHRNAILGRASTPEELEFLRGPDSSF